MHDNFRCICKSVRVTPAMEAGVDPMACTVAWIVGLVDANKPSPEKRGLKEAYSLNVKGRRYHDDPCPARLTSSLVLRLCSQANAEEGARRADRDVDAGPG